MNLGGLVTYCQRYETVRQGYAEEKKMRAKLSGGMNVPQEDRLLAKSELIVEERRDNQNQEYHRFGRRGVGTHREGRIRGGDGGMEMDHYKRLRMGLLKLASQLDMGTLQPYDQHPVPVTFNFSHK